RRPDLPVAIIRVVERALAVSVEERYATADALFDALDAAVGEPKVDHVSDAEHPRAKSLVVMPTQVFGESPDEFLADAVPNGISKYLARVPGLEVKRPPSRGDLERLGGDLEHIAALYGAAAYVISTVASSSTERLTLSVQLVDTRSRRILWSNDYEGATESPANLTIDAAEGIRQAVQPNAEPVRALPDKKSEIELLVQRGSYHLNMFTNLGRPSDVERAASAFEQAAALDPGNVDAAVGMALLHDARIPKGGPPAEAIPESEKWARRAIGIDPRCSTAWAVLCDLEGTLCELEPIRKPRRVAMALEYGLKAA